MNLISHGGSLTTDEGLYFYIMIVEEFNENYVTGWIKSYRSKFKHWIAKNKDYFYAWDWLLHNVNHKDGKVLINKELIEVKRGQRITSINNFADEVGMSPQQVRHFWDLLEKDKMITRIVTHRFTQITVCNYGTYQSEQQTNNKLTTNKQHTDNTLTTTNKNDKNDKNEKEINISFDDFWNLYDKKIDRGKCEPKWKRLTDKDRIAIMNYIPKYKKSITEKKFRRHPTTFLNNRTWENELIYEEEPKHIRPKSYMEWLDGRMHSTLRKSEYDKYIKKFEQPLVPGLENIGKI